MLQRVAFLVVGCLCLFGMGWTAIAGATEARAADQLSAPSPDWTGAYFNNTTLTGAPALTRDDGSTLDFRWPEAPAPEIGADYFSARWTTTYDVEAGVYRFTLTHDDGGRLLVDGVLVMEQWYMQAPSTYEAEVDLTPGPHTVTAEYYTAWRGAVAGLEMLRLPAGPLPPTPTATATNSGGAPTSTPTTAPTATPTIAPTLTPTPVASATPTTTPTPIVYNTPTPSPVVPGTTPDTGGGLLQLSELVGDYFNNTTLTTPDVLKRDDGTQLGFHWPDAPAPGVTRDYFSVRWGQVLTTDGGIFRFTLTHDDGARLFVDDKLVQENWYMQAPSTYVSDVTLAPGQHLVKIEYYHTWGGAVVAMDIRSLAAPDGPVVSPPTATVTSSVTPIPAPLTPTATASATPVPFTATATASVTPTQMATMPPKATDTAAPTATATSAPNPTPTATIMASSTATQLPAPTATATPLPGTRDKTLWPFASTSVWNMPIGSGAAYLPAGIAPRQWTTLDVEYLIFPKAIDPVVPFYTNGIWGSGRCSTSVFRYNLNLPADFVVPDARTGWTPNSVAAILAPDGRTLHQMNPVTRCVPGGPLTAGWVAPDQDIYGDGIRGGHGGSGLSSIGGSLRLGEITGSAPIRHALKVNLWAHVAISPTGNGHRWPAVTADSFYNDSSNPNHYAGAVPELRMGALLAIPAGVDLNALGLQTAAAKKLAWTLQNYGAYVVDDTSWDADAIDAQSGVGPEFQAAYGMSMEASTGTWHDDVMKLFAALNVVDNNGPTSIGGGGTPLQPLAPDIGG
jgi:hypothetical protein